MSIRFGVIGIDHGHIHGQVNALLGAGAQLVSFFAAADDLAAAFAARYPQARRAADHRTILDDASIQLVASAAIPCERAAIGIEAMQAGKDFMSDKPGATTLAQLDDLRRVQAATGRIWSVLYSEHHLSRCTVKAESLVMAGAIGEVLQVTGLGPHRLAAQTRPAWFFDASRTGGILCDLASHQVEQFLCFTGSEDAEVASARVANLAHPDMPGLQDFGEITLRAGRASAYVRVDWFTPAGSPVWGDVRLMLMGTEGSIELRKNIDLDGRPGGDHLLLLNAEGVQRVDCSGVELPWARKLVRDVLERSESAQPQARTFKAMEISLKAQAIAEASAPS